MTLEEVKEILRKEGWTSFQKLSYRPRGLEEQEFEKPIVVQALNECYDNHILPMIITEKREERYKKLKAEYDERHKAMEECDKTVASDYAQFMKWAHEHYGGFLKSKDGQVDCQDGKPVKGEHLNPALQNSAKQFNDALLDEQAKRIKGLTEQNKKQNDIIASRNTEIWELQEKVKKMEKMGKQIARLNEVIGKRNATIKDLKVELDEKDDLLECYRFSDKNKDEMISGLKKINEEYRHQLAAATVNKVNEQALKSAESALVYKDKVIDGLKKNISDAVDLLTESDGLHIEVVVKDPFEDFFKFIREHDRTK